MGFNRFGKIFQWTTFGESHGPSMGVVIDGCPSGVDYNEGLLLKNLALRRPGGDPSQKTKRVSQRKEKDIPRVLSGVWENKTLGTPIAVQVENQDSRSKDYEYLKNHPRPGHADDLWKGKFKHWDHRGGGRASARETVNWVIAGSFAQMFCLSQKKDIKVKTQIVSIGPMKINQVKWAEVEEMLAHAEKIGESYGGIVGVEVLNPPPFLGEPIFHKIKAQMAHAFMSINACCGVELGGGFAMAWEKGSHIHRGPDSLSYGGVRGGLTTGEGLFARLAFKPTSSLFEVARGGRHDPCVVLRVPPIVESLAWSILADQILCCRLDCRDFGSGI